MPFDTASYIMGYETGKDAGKSDITIEDDITCTDDGNANITITTGGN